MLLVTVQVQMMTTTTNTKVSSATIVFLVTLILLQTVSARRNLLDTGSPQTGYGEEKGDGSKSGVQRSESRDSGSANGDRSPTAGTVQMPPPTAVTSVSYNTGGGSNNNNNYQPSSDVRDDYSSPPGNYGYGRGGSGGSNTQPERPPSDGYVPAVEGRGGFN